MTNGTEVEKNPRIYEVSFLIAPSLPEEKVLETVAQIKDIFEKNGGAVVSDEFPKMRPLAYTVEKKFGGRIYKYDTAYFGSIKFESEATVLPLLKEFLEKSETIVRFLLVKTVRENTMASSKFIHAIHTDETKEPKHEMKREAVAEPAAPKMTTEELDKTIEELVVE